MSQKSTDVQPFFSNATEDLGASHAIMEGFLKLRCAAGILCYSSAGEESLIGHLEEKLRMDCVLTAPCSRSLDVVCPYELHQDGVIRFLSRLPSPNTWSIPFLLWMDVSVSWTAG